MPNFQYPPGAGGGGGGGSSPVQGGSGSFYGTIASAIAGEVEDAATTFAPQAGTAPGVVVGLGLSAVDDFYKDYWIVNESPVPSNGLQCRYARVARYVGATQTLTIDQPWDFVAETVIRLIRPIRIAILQDLAEDVTFTKNVEFDLEGHRLQGKIDQTAGTFCWIRNGWLTNGVQKTNLGVLRLDALSVSRRDDSIYAVLLTNGSDLGRTVLQNCHFFGIVAGRRGRAGWEIEGCRNAGIPEGSPTNRNIPYRLFESVAGVAVVVAQADVQVNSEWSGAVFYSENSLTGATAAVSVRIDAVSPKQLTAVTTQEQPVYSYLYCSVGGATLTMTLAANAVVEMKVTQVGTVFSPVLVGLSGLGLFVNFTGTFNVNGGSQTLFFVGDGANLAQIQIIGTAMMSGSITLAAIFPFYTAPGYEFDRILLGSTVSGTISDGSAVNVNSTDTCKQINNTAVQNQGTASITISGNIVAVNISSYVTFTAGTVSAGTWLISGNIVVDEIGRMGDAASLGTTVSGGTFTISGTVAVGGAGSSSTGGAGVLIVGLGRHGGTGGTLTLSGSLIRVYAHAAGTLFLAHATGAGATVVISAALVDIRNAKRLTTLTTALVLASTATSSASLTGAVRFENCEFRSDVNLLNATVVGGVASGPSSVVFESCYFEAALTDAIGAGTITWAAASLRFENCQVNGLFTFTGTRFSTVEAFETFFNGNSANKSITATGTRPTTYRLWKCGFRANEADLFPEILDDYAVIEASGVLTAGNLMTINATPRATNNLATSHLEGVLLISTAAAGEAAILVRRGKMDVTSRTVAPAVAAGDNCIADPATPTQQRQGTSSPGARVSRALEAVGARVAGKAYSLVNIG
jgi:hypothetical protein